MSNEKKTPGELADAIIAAPYNSDFLAAMLIGLVGVIAEGRQQRTAKQAARDVLEALADYDTFVAESPLAGDPR